MSVSSKYYGTSNLGNAFHLFTLTNSKGMSAEITNFGGIIRSLKTPDRQGNFGDVVLGFDHAEDYLINARYFGAIIGRVANRISNAKYKIDGKGYRLPANLKGAHLHGGLRGFNRRLWAAETQEGPEPALQLTFVSPDGDQGHPGRLTVVVTYRLKNDNSLEINYKAETDKPTFVNLTNHSYFNLSGNGGSILKNKLRIEADKFTPSNKQLLPTGEIEALAGTSFDLKMPGLIAEKIAEIGGEFDTNYVLSRAAVEPTFAAALEDAISGRKMEVFTTEKCLQLYTANFREPVAGKELYKGYCSVCLEAQGFPDAPNRPEFPSVRLDPDETYRQTTSYKFSVIG